MSEAACSVHDDVRVDWMDGLGRSRGTLNFFATFDRIRAAVDAGELRFLRGDSSLEQAPQLIRREERLSFTYVFECLACGTCLNLGIVMRGGAGLSTIPFDDIHSLPWETYETSVDNTAR